MRVGLRTVGVSGSPTRRALRVAALQQGQCPYGVLGLEPGATRQEVRAAYVAKMKSVHPDVASDDTTALASCVNLAYERLCAELASQGPDPEEDWNRQDAFDQPLGDASILFVNPFLCTRVNPLQWRDLNFLAQSSPDPEAALSQNGISFSSSAICYLTPEQMCLIAAELDKMHQTLDFEFCAWTLNDYLTRANRRQS